VNPNNRIRYEITSFTCEPFTAALLTFTLALPVATGFALRQEGFFGKDTKRCRVSKGFLLRLCAFAGEMFFPLMLPLISDSTGAHT
jgi:hypothetical protein